MKARTMALTVMALVMSVGMASAEATYAPGLEAEIYVVGKRGEVSDLPNRPSGVPLGVVVDRNAPLMDYNVFERNTNVAPYYDGNVLGVLWKGYVDIKDDGIHIISLGSNRDGLTSCSINSWINGNEISSIIYEIERSRGTSRFNATDQNAFDLSPGYYELSIWKVCVFGTHGMYAADRSQSRITLSMKTPSQSAIAPMDSSLLVHQVR